MRRLVHFTSRLGRLAARSQGMPAVFVSVLPFVVSTSSCFAGLGFESGEIVRGFCERALTRREAEAHRRRQQLAGPSIEPSLCHRLLTSGVSVTGWRSDRLGGSVPGFVSSSISGTLHQAPVPSVA